MFESIKRGVAAGAIAGAAYGLFTWLVANPMIAHLDGLAHGHEEAAAVPEATTAVVSAGGGVLWGVLLGVLFGGAYFLFEPALPGGRARAYVLAGAGFLTVSGAPWLVLPPVAPGAEQALATEVRLLLYGGMMALGAAVAALSVVAYNRVARERGSAAGLAAALAPFALLVVPVLLAPANATTTEAPAELVAAFRWLTVFAQVSLWALVAASYVRLEGVFGSTASAPATPVAD